MTRCGTPPSTLAKRRMQAAVPASCWPRPPRNLCKSHTLAVSTGHEEINGQMLGIIWTETISLRVGVSILDIAAFIAGIAISLGTCTVAAAL